MPGLVRAQSFADGPPRWYARRGSELLAGDSKVEVLLRIWEQDEAALGIFMSNLAAVRGTPRLQRRPDRRAPAA
jgi:hypothetical protein